MTLDDLRRNRNLLFWGLHTLGWSAYLITQYMGALLYEKPAVLPQGDPGRRGQRLPAVGAAALRLPLALGRPPAGRHRRRCCSRAWLTALAWRAVINYSYGASSTTGWTREPWYSIFSGTLSSTYLLVCWSGLYFGIKYYETLQQEREAALRPRRSRRKRS